MTSRAEIEWFKAYFHLHLHASLETSRPYALCQLYKKKLKACTSLDFTLKLEYTTEDDRFETVTAWCGSLVYLELSNSAIQESLLVTILSTYPTLHTLIFDDSSLRGDQLYASSLTLPSLTSLHVRDSPGIENTLCQWIAGACPQLQHLTLSKCGNPFKFQQKLTDQALEWISTCSTLLFLDVSSMSFTDQGMEFIATGCPLLQTLIITECTSITLKGIQSVKLTHPTLEIIV
jgi:hypothetical protein